MNNTMLKKMMDLAKESGQLMSEGFYIPDEVLARKILEGYFSEEKKQEVPTQKEMLANAVVSSFRADIQSVYSKGKSTIVSFKDGEMESTKLVGNDIFSYNIGVAVCIAKWAGLNRVLETFRQ